MGVFGQLLPNVHTSLPAAAGRAWIDRLAVTECPALTLRRVRQAERGETSEDPIVWHAATDCNVLDVDGNRYVDLSAGFGVAAVGHRHPQVVAALVQQGEVLLHALGDLHPSDVKVQLLGRLAELAPFDDARVILGLHGSDAIEAALKTAVLHTGRAGVVAFVGGYHGLSHGPLSICGYDEGFRVPFAAQLNPHVAFAPFPSDSDDPQRAVAAVAAVIDSAATPIGALVVEPLQGRGGVRVPPPGFLPGLAELCRDRGILLVADEIQTGLGRTGTMFLSVHSGAVPDLICLGKALGGGLPTSACIGRGDVMASWARPGREALHTGTFLGNPLLASAALASLTVLEEQRLAERAAELGADLLGQLRARLAAFAQVQEVRGVGLFVGVSFRTPGYAVKVVHGLLKRGYITVPAALKGDVLSLTPPLTITPALLAGFLDALVDTLGALAEESS